MPQVWNNVMLSLSLSPDLQTLVNGSTIQVGGRGMIRIYFATSVTGIKIAPGTRVGQWIALAAEVAFQAAAEFDVPSVSNVLGATGLQADRVSEINASFGRTFSWNGTFWIGEFWR